MKKEKTIMVKKLEEIKTEKVERKTSTSLYLTVLVLTLMVFGAGLWIGNMLANQVTSQLYNEIDAVQANTVNLEVLSLLESNQTPQLTASLCRSIERSLQASGLQTEEVGRKLQIFEEKRSSGSLQLGSRETETYSLKQRYFALEARDYLLLKKFKTNCNSNFSLVLFFYAHDCQNCGEAQRTLEDLKKSDPQRILIYSFDLDYANTTPSVLILSSIYSVRNAPSIIVNERSVATQHVESQVRNAR